MEALRTLRNGDDKSCACGESLSVFVLAAFMYNLYYCPCPMLSIG